LIKICVTSPSFSKNEVLREELLRWFPGSIFNDNGERLEGNRLIEYLSHADGVVIGLEKMNKTIIDSIPSLKIISKFGVGLDNIDLTYCRSKNIRIGWTPGVNKLSVAEMTLSFMIMLLRNLYTTSNQLKNGVWNKSGGLNLTGKTVGIIGVGNIGKEVIRLLGPFKCRVLVNDIIDQSEYYKDNECIEVSKDEIFSQSDIITIHTPLDESTKYLVNSEMMNKIKKTSFVINTARGGIINMADLKKALKDGAIAGAAVDVYEGEPPVDRELLCIPNLICTPHIGGNSYESVVSMGRSAISHLQEFFKT